MTDDLGHDHHASPIVDDNNNQLIGCVLEHPDLEKPGHRCQGRIYFDVPATVGIIPERKRWHVVSLAPLSLTPSVQCTRCGDWGWIRVGRWVPTNGR